MRIHTHTHTHTHTPSFSCTQSAKQHNGAGEREYKYAHIPYAHKRPTSPPAYVSIRQHTSAHISSSAATVSANPPTVSRDAANVGAAVYVVYALYVVYARWQQRLRTETRPCS